MGNPASTIELNGKRYDARTGRIISESSNQTASATRRSEPGMVLDGFVRRTPPRNTAAQSSAEPSKVQSSSAQSPKTTVKNTKRKLEKSKTLMRPAVKKPTAIKNDIQPMKPVPKLPAQNSGRINRAQAVEKSPHISKFGNPATSSVKKVHADLPVVAPSFAVLSKNVSNELHKLENALIDANSHLHELEKNTVKKVPLLQRVGFKNRFANLAALTTAMLLLVGFFGYQNSAAISMRIAATRSGVNAQLPGYQPAGFGVAGGVKSEPGKVSVSFKSRTDDRSFTITQQASNWNSASLLANHVSKNYCNTCFQTWQDSGKTVYIYDKSNATWVNGGVWYTVEGNADLTSDQLMRLANSL